jgi:putative transposase
MAGGHGRGLAGVARARLLDGPGCPRGTVERALQAIVDEETTAHLGAARSERSDGRTGHCHGDKRRARTTRVGTIDPRVPHDRDGTFSTDLFARDQRSERASVATPKAMVPARRLPRNVAAITGERGAAAFARSPVSAMAGRGVPPGPPGTEGAAGAAADGGVPSLPGRRCPLRARASMGGWPGVLVVAGVRDEGRREMLAGEEADAEREATSRAPFARRTGRRVRGVETRHRRYPPRA